MCEWEREPRLECGGVSERVSERVSDELLGKEIIMEEDVNEEKNAEQRNCGGAAYYIRVESAEDRTRAGVGR